MEIALYNRQLRTTVKMEENLFEKTLPSTICHYFANAFENSSQRAKTLKLSTTTLSNPLYAADVQCKQHKKSKYAEYNDYAWLIPTQNPWRRFAEG